MNEKKTVFIRTGKTLISALLALGAITPVLPQMVLAQEQGFALESEPAQKNWVEKTETAEDVTIEATGGDHKVDLALPAASSFTFSANVTFTNYGSENDEHSAALLFAGMAANVHEKINWNRPVRLWSDDGMLKAEAACPGESGAANTWLSENQIDLEKTFNLKVVVSQEDKSVRYFINDILACQGELSENYTGGNFGLMTYKSTAAFTDIQLTTKVEDTTEPTAPAPDAQLVSALNDLVAKCEGLEESDYTSESYAALQQALNDAKAADQNSNEAMEAAITALNEAFASLEAIQKPAPSTGNVAAGDFVNVGAAGMKIEGESLVLDASGDHFAMLDTQKSAANDFHLEADVTLLEGTNEGDEGSQKSAALVFGASNKKTPGTKWYGANVDTRRSQNADFFRVFGAGKDILSGGAVSDVDASQPIHLAIDVKADGSFTYTFGNTGQNLHEVSGTIENWEGGYAGLLTFCAKASFTNISFTDRTQARTDQVLEANENCVLKGGDWSITEEGLVSDAQNQGDTFLISPDIRNNFVFETDMKYESDGGAAGLVFRFEEGEYGKEGYAVNVDAGSHKAKFWRWQNNSALQLIDEKDVGAADNYHLKVVCLDGSIQYLVNDVLIANLSDHTMQKNDLGQSTYISQGQCGLLNWNAKAVFQNTNLTVLNEADIPAVSDVTVTSTGTVGKKAQFFPDSATWIQYVNYDASTIALDARLQNSSSVVFEKEGTTYQAGQEIPLSVGINWITMTVTKNGVSRIYRLDVHRFDQDSVYYNEPYRDQYHYSVKEGWANDPNGLVYYKGKYHMFYQFYDDNKWGPMHWMHATSTRIV